MYQNSKIKLVKPDMSYQDYHKQGIEMHKQGKLDEAINFYHRAIAINSNYFRTHYSIGNSLLQKSKLDEALFYYHRCIELKPDFFKAYKKIGETLVKKEKIDDALFYYREAIRYNSKSSKRLIELIDKSCRAIERDPNSTQSFFWKGNALASLGWTEQAIICHHKTISNSSLWPSFDSKNYQFTQNNFTSRIPIWQKYLNRYTNAPHTKALEIGSLEGMSACWLLDNILIHPSAEITCIDPCFTEQFDHNISATNVSNKVIKLNTTSQEAVDKLNDNYYDFVYIDGFHLAADVLKDSISCWRVTKIGGLMIFDDYLREPPKNRKLTPKIAIDTFLSLFEKIVELMHKDYQVIIKKVSNSINFEKIKNIDINFEIESRINN